MADAIELGGDVAAAGTALAGLLLVFIGAISSSFDSYDKREQKSVVVRYRRRAGFALIGFILALISAALALIAKWLSLEAVAVSALIILLLAFAWSAVAAIRSVKEIE